MPRIFSPLAFAAASMLALAACQQQAAAPPGPTADGVDLRGSTLALDFTLTNDKGESVSWADLGGAYRIVYLGYAYCPDVCPVDLQRTSQGLEQFEKAHPALGRKVQPIFITVDPSRDTVEVVHEFVGNFHPRLIGLTGPQDEIDKVMQQVGASASKSEANETGAYLVNHTNFTYLFAPDGTALGLLPSDKGPDAIAKELEAWIR